MAKQSFFSPLHKDLDLHMTITQKKHMEAQQESFKLNTNFKGTKNGEVTPVAIKEEFCPNEVIIGSEKKL